MSTTTLQELYQEMILDHYHSPSNRESSLPGEDAHVHHSNPTCGDELDVRVDVEEGRVKRVVFDGEGCSICLASASTMTEAVEDREVGDACALVEEFRRMMHGDDPEREDDLGDAIAFRGVAKFPVRIKCALLAWMAVKDALSRV